MDYIRLSRRYQRINLSSNDENLEEICFNRHLKMSPLQPQSNMLLEFDVFTDDIVNPYLATKSQYNIQGLEFIWSEERRRCELLGLELQAFTPGCVGTPEIWTNHENVLRNELKEAMQTIKSVIKSRSLESSKADNNLSSALNSQQQQPLSQLSQQVIDDIQTQFLEEAKLNSNTLNVETSDNTNNNDTLNASTSRCYQITANRFGGLKPMDRKQVSIWEDRQDNEEDEGSDSEADDTPFQDFLSKKTSKNEIVLTNEEESDSDNLEIIDDICFDETNHQFVPQLNTKSNQNTRMQKSKGYRFVEPRTNTPILLCSDEHIPSTFIASDSNDECRVNTRYTTQSDFANETWNKGDTLTDTLSHIEVLYDVESMETTKSQEAYDRLMRLVKSGVDNLCVLSVEILALSSQSDIRPLADPKHDFISAIFYAIDLDVCNRDINRTSNITNSHNVDPGSEQFRRQSQFYGRIALNTLRDFHRSLNGSEKMANEFGIELPPIYVSHELQLFAELTNIVQRYDPEILIGYDITRFSWGYLYERAEFLSLPFLYNISRIKDPRTSGVGLRHSRRECFRPPHGRIQLEVWRVLRKENANLRCYRFGSVVNAILKRKFPEFQPQAVISALKETDKQAFGIKETILRHFMHKCTLNIDLLDASNIFIKTSQMAHVYGIQFIEVLSRGSQFRVESILLRLATRQRFMAPSISDVQRNLMGSPETIPLNLEPESGIYYDPIVVLDFQSLYPSVCIAYNYCFTTCLGKLARIKSLANNICNTNSSTLIAQPTIILGAMDNYELYDVEKILNLLETDQLNISPTGGIFLKTSKRKSLLAQMLQELLDTRIMVKKAMKQHAKCEVGKEITIESLIRLLDARQLALKLVANVTYGYTAANWSGRMPCEELADAIVSKGRETLERAIQTIHENSANSIVNQQNNNGNNSRGSKYGNARVIYGDTDSLFVLFQGHSKREAFDLGEQIAADISAANPYPMKLKFEKVMQPCALITKKRYVGMSYERVEQTVGKFDAKGIETVRRDACEFVGKTMESVLRLLFDVRPPVEDLGNVQKEYSGGLDAALQYLKYRLMKLREIPLLEFVLSNEYREHYAPTAVLPVKRIAEELAGESARLALLRGERVSYVIALGRTAEQKRKLHSAGIFGSSAPFVGMEGSVTSHAVAIDKYLSDSSLDIYYDYYVTRQLFPALMRFFQLIGVRLRWRNGEAFRNYCIGCTAPNVYPWCANCAKCAKSIVVRRCVQTQHLSKIRRSCRECLNPVKSLQNIEDLLALRHCVNFACTNRQVLTLTERMLLPPEFKCHISSHSLKFLNDF